MWPSGIISGINIDKCSTWYVIARPSAVPRSVYSPTSQPPSVRDCRSRKYFFSSSKFSALLSLQPVIHCRSRNYFRRSRTYLFSSSCSLSSFFPTTTVLFIFFENYTQLSTACTKSRTKVSHPNFNIIIKIWIFETRLRIEKQSKLSKRAAPTLNSRRKFVFFL